MKPSVEQRHRLFVDNLIKCKFNQTEAYRLTYPKSSKKSCEDNSSRLIGYDRVQKILEEKIAEIGIDDIITKELILQNLLSLAKTSKREADRIRAWELLGKYRTLWQDKTSPQTIAIFNDIERELEARKVS